MMHVSRFSEELVMWMSLAGIDDLKLSRFRGNLREPADIQKQKIRALVDCGPPGETQGKNIRTHAYAGNTIHMIDENLLRC